jgi:hypothetical protein
VGFSSEDDPEPTLRTRSEKSEEAALREAERLVSEQLADGFVEVGPKPETADAFFEKCAARWATAAPSVPVFEWLEVVMAMPAPLRTRFADELRAVGEPATWRDSVWLRMQVPTQPTPFLLTLREPSVGGLSLWVLDAFVVPRPLVGRLEWMGALDHAPLEHAPYLEGALVSLLEVPPETPIGASVVLDRFPFSEGAVARIRALLVREARIAGPAAMTLGRAPYLKDASLRADLARWLERSDVSDGAKSNLARRAGPELGLRAASVLDVRRTLRG